jgi:hypothetical protein
MLIVFGFAQAGGVVSEFCLAHWGPFRLVLRGDYAFGHQRWCPALADHHLR